MHFATHPLCCARAPRPESSTRHTRGTFRATYETDARSSDRQKLFPMISLQQGLYVFSGAAQYRSIAAFNDRTLNEIRMLDHQRNDLIITELTLC
jgi:hypothetical protein